MLSVSVHGAGDSRSCLLEDLNTRVVLTHPTADLTLHSFFFRVGMLSDGENFVFARSRGFSNFKGGAEARAEPVLTTSIWFRYLELFSGRQPGCRRRSTKIIWKCATSEESKQLHNEAARETSAYTSSVCLLPSLRVRVVCVLFAAQVTHRHISWAAAATLKECLERDFRVMQVGVSTARSMFGAANHQVYFKEPVGAGVRCFFRPIEEISKTPILHQ